MSAPRFAFSVRRIPCAPLRPGARFAEFCLRDALALLEAVFVAREAVLARPRALTPPPDLEAPAGDLGAGVFPRILLRDGAVLDIGFLEAADFPFLEPGAFFAGGRPRAFVPRPGLEPLVFDDLAINDSLISRVAAVIPLVGRRREFRSEAAPQRVPVDCGDNSEPGTDPRCPDASASSWSARHSARPAAMPGLRFVLIRAMLTC